jgi:NADPH:quinone reductase-like Zn-dependent oxidoreductase
VSAPPDKVYKNEFLDTPRFTVVLPLALEGKLKSMTGSQKMVPLPPQPPNESDQVVLKELLESGKLRPVIDRRFSLSEIPDALRYLETGHARGKVVITV